MKKILMKVWLLILCCFALLSCSGERPTDLGVNKGQLKPCPDSPNCVSSQGQDEEHRIEALSFSTSVAEAKNRIKEIVNATERAEIITEKEDYLYVEFTSRIMRFVDDVEFYFDAGKGEIQVRSASRIGKGDMGVNRDRIEAIRKQF